MKLTDPVAHIPGIGESFAKKLLNLNIHSVGDLLDHFPSRFQDFTQITPIDQLAPDRTVCIKAKLTSFHHLSTKTRFTRRFGGLTIQKATVSDETSQIQLIWFNQPFLRGVLKPNQIFYFTGTVNQFRGQLSLNSPEYEAIKDTPIHTARLVPIYPQTQGVSSKWLRHKISLALKNTLPIPDPLDTYLPPGMFSQIQAYQQIHFPDDLKSQQAAQQRLAFNDLLAIYLKANLTKKAWDSRQATPISINQDLHHQLLRSLPFPLTADQHQAIKHLFTDLQKPIPANRLLQGDVGSGKTMVALAATLQVIHQGHQVILMVPTQILANQHLQTFTNILKPFNITPTLITSTTKNKNYSLRTNNYQLLIGTHALLHQPNLLQATPKLLIIDEQHRFGVLQRSHFLNSSTSPHLLTLSATPIPRTVALSFYGHLDISNIETLPPGRLPVKTWVVPEIKRQQAYTWIKQQLQKGDQAFVVCPFIETSTADNLKIIKAAVSEFERLKQIFPQFELALLHGKVATTQKERILEDFKTKKYQLLVTTPVIEVGLDIPSATIMVIEDAARFGLSQLHQLRGRVGREAKQSYCLIFTSELASLPRLKFLEKNHSGLKLAKYDLQLRGAGEVFGTAQSGHLDTQFASFWKTDLNHLAKETAHRIANGNEQLALNILQKLNISLANNVSSN